MTWRDWLAQRNALTIGVGYDGSRSAFHQSTQLGYLNPDRSVTGLNAFADGVTGGSVDGEPFDNRVDLEGRVHTGSVFASDVLPIGDAWNVTLVRTVQPDDHPQCRPAEPGRRTGLARRRPRLRPLESRRRRDVQLRPAMNLYAGYSEGSRAPDLDRTGLRRSGRTVQAPECAGGRSAAGSGRHADVGSGRARRTRRRHLERRACSRPATSDDILFVASTQTGFGYFKNFGSTRRQGLELGVNGRHGRWSGGAGYTWLDATFESAGNGQRQRATARTTRLPRAARDSKARSTIRPGDRIPLIPRHMLKAFADCQVTSRLSLDVDLVAASGVFARGNENNVSQPDGTYYLGPGTTPAYGIVNLGAHYQLTRRVQLLAQINNLFDRHYYTAAQLGPTGFTATGHYIARALPAIQGEFPVQQATFYAPGAPAAYWVGTRVKF